MNRSISFLLALCVLAFGLSDCSPPSTAETILGDDSGHFRGINMGSSLEDVKLKEGEPKISKDNELIYEYELEEIGTYTVSYVFEEEHGLTDLAMETNLKSDEDVDELFALLKAHYSSKFSDPFKDEGDYVYWQSPTEDFQEVDITLIDHREVYDYGRVFLNIYVYKY